MHAITCQSTDPEKRACCARKNCWFEMKKKSRASTEDNQANCGIVRRVGKKSLATKITRGIPDN
uniref:Uncharacterized protein n=1 Tax=Triticum urartu TaxID=4572 RepID=A0A8R7PC87_TRIUA